MKPIFRGVKMHHWATKKFDGTFLIRSMATMLFEAVISTVQDYMLLLKSLVRLWKTNTLCQQSLYALTPERKGFLLSQAKEPLRSLAMLEWKLTSSWIGENCYRWAIYALMNEYRWQLFWKSISTNINQGVVIKTIKEVPLLFWNNDGYM